MAECLPKSFIHTEFTKITEVNLSAFVHRLFRKDFSPLVRTTHRIHKFLFLHFISGTKQLQIYSEE